MKNHEPLEHLILVLSQMDMDIARIAIQADDAQSALLGDCVEHRMQMLNKLRHIKQQWQNPLDRQLVSRAEILRNAHEASFAIAGDDLGDPEIASAAEYNRKLSDYMTKHGNNGAASREMKENFFRNAYYGGEKIMFNDLSDPEITPETKADPVPSALARYRQRQRCAYLAAWVIAVVAAAVILAAIRFAVQHAPF